MVAGNQDVRCHPWITGSLVLGVLALASICAADEAVQDFNFSAYGYTLQLPANWHLVPQEEVQRCISATPKLAENFAQSGIIWEAVYQDSADVTEGRFIYPYVICQVIPYRTGKAPTEAEISEELRSISPNAPVEEIKTGNDTLDRALSATSVGQPRYDPATHTIYQSLESPAPGIGTVKWFIVTHYGNSAEVDLMFYDRGDRFASHEAVFEQIQSSFKFNAAAAYPKFRPAPTAPVNVTAPPITPNVKEQNQPSHEPQAPATRYSIVGLIAMWIFQKFGWVGLVVFIVFILWSAWADRRSA